MGAYINVSNTSSTWAFRFSQQHLKWSGGVLHSPKHRDNRPKWFRNTIQLTKGKFCHQLGAKTRYKQGGLSNKGSSREKILHATSQVVSWVKTKLEGNGWVETVKHETNTSKPKLVEMTTSILPKEGKTNEYRSRTSNVWVGTSIHNIDTSKSTYLYDLQIMILNANTCHKNEYKSNDNHNTI